MEVFIGSSSQGKDDLAAVASLIKAEGMTPRPWSRSGTFDLNAGIWASLLKLTKEVYAGAFVFREDDEMLRQDRPVGMTRDNVILEFGLFCGALGAQRCAIFQKGQPWIPEDLKGVTVVSLDDRKAAKQQVRQWAMKLKGMVKHRPPLSLLQIRAIGQAMLETDIFMDRVYVLLEELGVSKDATNDALR